ncbi:hypothetical protein [Pseudoalteromonas ostreae]|uniref:hypothetical protein n=1 Tax=Pseudoalteromonas ostreae TaxID=2774154 RepID=UPI001B37AA87|nr:hypothetical protein [Pseudoalteromonas ostreae]
MNFTTKGTDSLRAAPRLTFVVGDGFSHEGFCISDKFTAEGAKLAGARGYGFVRRATNYGTILVPSHFLEPSHFIF